MRRFSGFYFEQFLFGFCRRVPLVGALLLAIALVFVPDVNQAFGIRYLLWHEDSLKQGAVGFALGALVVQTLLAGYLIETQRTPPKRRVRWGRLNPALTYGIGIIGCTLITTSPLFIAVGHLWTDLGDWELAVGFLPAVALYLFGVSFLCTERREESWVAKLGYQLFEGMSHIRLLHVPRAAPCDMAAHGIAVLAFLFSMLVYLAVGIGPLGLFSPLVGVFALGGILIASYGFFEYFLDRIQPAVFLVVFALVFMGGSGKFAIRFPDLEPNYQTPTALADYNPAARADLLPPEAIEFCKEARGPYVAGQKRPLVVVCVSGGGIRAAAWATAVLHQLEREFAALTVKDHPMPVDFPCHIRIVTGASGGMVGAAYYVANLPSPPPTPLQRIDLFRQYDAITEDMLSPVVHAMTYHDVRAVFSPFGHPRDRGQALEAAWAKNLRGTLEQPFDRLKEGERHGWRPSLVFSPMLVEDGRRLLVSNLDLRGVASNDGSILQEVRDPQTDPTLPLRQHLNRFSYESLEFFRLFPQPEVRSKFRLATAARMSASFPYLSPAATLPTEPRRRVVDAGYYDNDGVSLASSWLFSGGNRDWIKKNASKIVLIQIRDGASEPRRKLQHDAADTTSALSRGLEFATGPPSALFNARVGSSSYRNDGLLEILSQQLVNELQLRPLLASLAPDEERFLRSVRDRDILVKMRARLARDPARLQQFRAALAARMSDPEAATQFDRANRIMQMMDEMPTASVEQQRRWKPAMDAMKLDDRPEQWVDRVMRSPDLQAASLELTPDDEVELRRLFSLRLRSPADAERLLQRVKWTLDSREGSPYFTTITFEYGGEASLSWYLTKAERADILEQAGKLGPRIELLKQWWLAPAE